jgi:tricorn protease interacting factor F2/3
MPTHKLPEHVKPDHYDLYFEPNFKTFKFNGASLIDIHISKPTDTITLNSSELSIKRATLTHRNHTVHPIYSLDNETITLHFHKKIAGKVQLAIGFQGILNDKLAGFYKSQYKQNGKTKYLATSQFEAPYARMAFPCFDQPDMKATFSVSMEVPKKLEAISNMPAISTTFSGSKKIVSFKKTPLMSTYLLYLGVGEFEYLTSKYKNTELRIVTTPGKSKEGKFALDIAKKFLAYFEEYSGISYPLPKLDLLAIPDFNAGAMENWGAITFREVLLLLNKETSLSVKKRIAEVIAHELWHG